MVQPVINLDQTAPLYVYQRNSVEQMKTMTSSASL